MNKNRCRNGLLGLLLTGCVFPAFATAEALDAEDIDALAARAMERFHTPGIAIGVVQDGELVYAAGHGLRDIRRDDAVDEDTIFQIASLSKAFTTTALGILVDEGKLDWDDRVIDHLPNFRMSDPWVTREFTIRDLLTHRSGLGLGAGDLLFWPEQQSTAGEVVLALRHLQPETSFRTAYAYDNLLYIVAGEIVRTVSGMPWEDFVESRIMSPLGMSDCRAAPGGVVDSNNRAVPHMLVKGELQTTFFSGGGAAVAAGGVNCNVSGLARWASMHLAQGALPDGDRLLSEETQAELWKPVTLLRVSGMSREHGRTHFAAYALGWGLADFYGHLRVGHGGALQGMTTYIALLPEKDVAVIVLTNQFTRASQAVANEILSAYITESPEDWVEIYGGAADQYSADAASLVAKAFDERNALSRPSLPLDAYAGVYTDAWYGDVTVARKGDGLQMRFSRSKLLQGPLQHFQYDTFVARWTDRSLLADAYATFSVGPDGKVESIRMEWVSPDTDFSYDFHHLDLRRRSE